MAQRQNETGGDSSRDRQAEGAPWEGMSLERYAQLSAQMAEGDRPPSAVLAAHGVGEEDWQQASQHWLLAMANDAQANGADAELALVYAEAFGRAQEALKPLVPMTPEEWALLTVEVQRSGGPAQPLARRRLSNADYLRLGRHFARTLARDPALAQRFAQAYEALQPRAGA
jgi:hypothetical protein